MGIIKWRKFGTSKRHSWPPPPRKDRSTLTGVDARAKQIAFDRLALLREYQYRLSKPRRPKTKGVVIRKFVAEVNAGMLRPEGASKFISHISKSGLCKFWNDYKARGISGLVPRYKYKGNSSTQKPTFRFVAKPFEMKFAGRPRRNGKKEFQARIRRRWKWPPSENPIRLAIYYSMPIPKGIKMPMRKKMIRQKMFHINKPNIDALNGFVVDCFSGIVLKDHSQIVHFHSEKKFETWPQVRILIQELKA